MHYRPCILSIEDFLLERGVDFIMWSVLPLRQCFPSVQIRNCILGPHVDQTDEMVRISHEKSKFSHNLR